MKCPDLSQLLSSPTIMPHFIRIPIVWHEEIASKCNSLCTHISVGCAKSQPRRERERDEVKRVKYGEMNYGYFTRKSPAYEVVFTCILQLTSRPASNNFVKKINSCDLLNTNT